MKKQEKITSLGKIVYSIRRGNPLIVFLNSFGSFDAEQSFAKVINSLPQSFGILAPDYLNSGFSGKSLVPYTISQETDQIANIINAQHSQKVILVAHSIGGVYAYHLQHKIVNLAAIIGIEPTTREVIANPPQEYAAHTEDQNSVGFIRSKINDLFSSEEAKLFWQTTENNSKKFDQAALQNATAAMENDQFWQSTGSLDQNIPVVLVTEAYRKKEYQRSEYFNQNLNSKILTLGSFHYIHWEYSMEIVELIKEYSQGIETGQ